MADRYPLPLLMRFQENFEDGATRRRSSASSIPQEQVSATVRVQSKRGFDDRELNQSISDNLTHIVSTTDLQAVINLEGLDFVKRSVLNFGIADIHSIFHQGQKSATVLRHIVAAVTAFEPRILPQSVELVRDPSKDDTGQRLSFHMKAEISTKPMTTSLEMVAELDLSSGKVKIEGGRHEP